MYARKTLTMTIATALMFGVGACSMQEKQVDQANELADSRAEHDAVPKSEEAVRLNAVEIVQLEAPPAPPPAPAKASTGQAAGNAVLAQVMVRATTPQPMALSDVVERERYAEHKDNGVQRVAEQPVSTFSIDVDTGSYSNVRRMLNDGQLPPRDAVRAEEFINYFDYGYAPPTDRKTPFAVHTEVAPTPWQARHALLRVGIQGYRVPAERIPAANLVFLIDTSGSMDSPDKIGLLKQSFMAMVPKLRAQDRVSIVVYAGSAGLVLPPTSGSDHAAILAALEQLSAGGSTAGAAGIELAYQQAKRAYIEGGVNRVILATDGDFNVGTVDLEALKTMVAEQRRSGVSLTTLGFGEGNYNDELSEQLADIGNGNHAYIDTLHEGQRVLVESISSTLFTIAKDVKIQVEFNPAVVSEYRLIGYENRTLAREDFNNDAVDAGEIGAGHDVTAIYEIVLAGSGGEANDPLRYGKPVANDARDRDELAFVKLRYKAPDGDVSTLLERPVRRRDMVQEASGGLRFAAAVAAFADRLRGGEHIGRFGFDEIAALASGARGEDRYGDRGEFIELVTRAKSLAGESSPVAVVSE